MLCLCSAAVADVVQGLKDSLKTCMAKLQHCLSVQSCVCVQQLLHMQDLKESLETCKWLPMAPGWTEHYTAGLQQPFYYHQATGCKQWHRPAAVQSESASTPLAQLFHSPALSRQFSGSESSDTLLKEAATRKPLVARQRASIRPAEKSRAKRCREEDVGTKLAGMCVNNTSGLTQLLDCASSLEAARAGQGRWLKKLSPVSLFKHDIQEAKQCVAAV